MPACVALLLALAGPALAAPPPLSPTADNDAINDEITAGDPAFTDPPAPLERLLAAADMAEGRLREAANEDDATDLLTLTVDARKAAYRRTSEALHLCRLIAAADHVLAREGLSPGLSGVASDFREEAQASLGARTCGEAQPREQTAPRPSETEATPAGAAGPPEHAAVRPAPPPVDRADRRRFRAGVGTLVPGLLLFAPVAGLMAYRAEGERELAAIRVDTRNGTPTLEQDRDAAALGQRFTSHDRRGRRARGDRRGARRGWCGPAGDRRAAAPDGGRPVGWARRRRARPSGEILTMFNFAISATVPRMRRLSLVVLSVLFPGCISPQYQAYLEEHADAAGGSSGDLETTTDDAEPESTGTIGSESAGGPATDTGDSADTAPPTGTVRHRD